MVHGGMRGTAGKKNDKKRLLRSIVGTLEAGGVRVCVPMSL